MTLREKRCLFTRLIAEHILWLFAQGWEVSVDQFKRTQAEANSNADQGIGIRNSLHIIGLAGDLLLYKNGAYLSDSSAHAVSGEKWKSRHPLCRWGGDFSKPDGGHYSLEHEGVK